MESAQASFRLTIRLICRIDSWCPDCSDGVGAFHIFQFLVFIYYISYKLLIKVCKWAYSHYVFH